jgi:hypothetical protein
MTVMKNKFIIQSVIGILLCVPAVAMAVTFTGATKFFGTLNVTGALSKSGSYFMIDHPLDPTNKLLYHSSVESPDSKNLYDGTATLDIKGEATVQLPAWFDALNNTVRYQFSPLGQAMPNLYIKEEEQANHFTIAGGVAGGKVYWQITGIRHDPYILKHPVINEVDKGPGKAAEKGTCLYEPACK